MLQVNFSSAWHSWFVASFHMAPIFQKITEHFALQEKKKGQKEKREQREGRKTGWKVVLLSSTFRELLLQFRNKVFNLLTIPGQPLDIYKHDTWADFWYVLTAGKEASVSEIDFWFISWHAA